MTNIARYILLVTTLICFACAQDVKGSSRLADIEASTTLQHRIAFGSCFNPFRGGLIWSLIKKFHPNQLLLLGDQFYADYNPKTGFKQSANPEIIENGYKAFFGLSSFQTLIKSLSHGWLATYDDHDYGKNNHDKTFRYRDESIQLFAKYMPFYNPIQSYNAQHKTGVYSSEVYTIKLNNKDRKELKYKVILLDSRSNKDPMFTPEGDFLGPEQWAWLEHELSYETLRDVAFVLIGSSIQVLPTEKLIEESWSEFPAQRQRLLALIQQARRYTTSDQIYLLSGDIHNAEINQLRCDNEQQKGLVEVTSSGLSHTFIKVTKQPLQQQQVTKKEDEEEWEGKELVVPIVSRGILMELINGLYQVIYIYIIYYSILYANMILYDMIYHMIC